MTALGELFNNWRRQPSRPRPRQTSFAIIADECRRLRAERDRYVDALTNALAIADAAETRAARAEAIVQTVIREDEYEPDPRRLFAMMGAQA